MLEDISLMRALPNMTVIVPADGEETKAAVRWAASYHGPVYIRMGRANAKTSRRRAMSLRQDAAPL